VYFALGAGTIFVDEHDTLSGASYGHAMANGAASVGAAPWYNTAAWGHRSGPLPAGVPGIFLVRRRLADLLQYGWQSPEHAADPPEAAGHRTGRRQYLDLLLDLHTHSARIDRAGSVPEFLRDLGIGAARRCGGGVDDG
jgi:hypothetical protein